jgi:hypothetical protein
MKTMMYIAIAVENALNQRMYSAVSVGCAYGKKSRVVYVEFNYRE